MMYRLRLVNDDGTEELDLLHGPLRVTNWGWTTQPAPLKQNQLILPFGNQASSVGYSPCIESLSLAVHGCQDDIRAAIRDLERFLENAAAHHDDPLVYSPQWIEWVTPGEFPKRSLLTGGTWAPITAPPIWPMLEGEILRVNLALTRHPLWENVTVVSDTEDSLSSVGGTWLLAATAGRVPARIRSMELMEGADIIYPYFGGLAPVTKIWAGFRPEYKGLTDFEPVWECETIAVGGHSIIIDVANTANNAAPAYISSNATTAQTTFADTNLNAILSITVGALNPFGQYSHFAGRYLVLCRCWVNTGSAYLQMRHGWYESVSPTACDPVLVDNTHALYKELGTIQIPPPGLWDTSLRNFNRQCGNFTIWLYSQNIAATPATTMDLDCLVLIPADYFIKVDNAYIWETGLGTDYMSIVETLPNERIIGYTAPDDPLRVITSAAAVNPSQWYLPQGDSLLVIAAEEATDQVIDDVVDISLAWYPRWTSYRE